MNTTQTPTFQVTILGQGTKVVEVTGTDIESAKVEALQLRAAELGKTNLRGLRVVEVVEIEVIEIEVGGLCACGCKFHTAKGSIFRQGHDAKLVSKLIKAVMAGEMDATEAVKAAGRISDKLRWKTLHALVSRGKLA